MFTRGSFPGLLGMKPPLFQRSRARSYRKWRGATPQAASKIWGFANLEVPQNPKWLVNGKSKIRMTAGGSPMASETFIYFDGLVVMGKIRGGNLKIFSH